MSVSARRGARSVLVYRRHLDVRSGTGQLVLMQAAGLRAAGHTVSLAARRGRLRTWLRTGEWAHRVPDVAGASPPRPVVIDHSCELDHADLVFVHNLFSVGLRYLQRHDWKPLAAAEVAFFSRVGKRTPIVANSRMIEAALVDDFGLEPGRVCVIYPGYCTRRFDPAARPALRQRARAALGAAEAEPIIGLVASGDLTTRGLDIFLEAAVAIVRELPAAKFLVVGSKRLPEYALEHPLHAQGKLIHRPKSGAPERWMSALDVFLHASHFDAYGMVVTEALALGVPVVTSMRCGVAEVLRGRYGTDIPASPDPVGFAERAIGILADRARREAMIAAGLDLARDSTDTRYGERCAALIARAVDSEPAAQIE